MDEEIQKRRFPWWRLARWSVALLIAAAIIGHAMWGSVAEQGVNRRVQALRDAGEPVLPQDFTPPHPNDSENAAVDVEAAANMIDEKDPVWEAYSREDLGLPLRPKERDAVVAVMQKFGPALDRVDQGRNKPAMEPKLNLTSPVMFNLTLANLANVRGLCVLEGSDALLEHERGDDATALRRLDRVLFIAKYPQKYPTLIGQLVAMGCSGLAADRVAQLAPDLKIGADPGSASPRDVRALIDQLLDDREPRQAFINGFRGERMSELDAVQGMANGLPISLSNTEPATPIHPMKRYALRPVFYRNARTILDHLTAMIDAAGEPNLPAAKAKMPQLSQDRSILDFLTNMMLPSL
jgi:hypothetical protein